MYVCVSSLDKDKQKQTQYEKKTGRYIRLTLEHYKYKYKRVYNVSSLLSYIVYGAKEFGRRKSNVRVNPHVSIYRFLDNIWCNFNTDAKLKSN